MCVTRHRALWFAGFVIVALPIVVGAYVYFVARSPTRVQPARLQSLAMEVWQLGGAGSVVGLACASAPAVALPRESTAERSRDGCNPTVRSPGQPLWPRDVGATNRQAIRPRKHAASTWPTEEKRFLTPVSRSPFSRSAASIHVGEPTIARTWRTKGRM